MKQRIVVKDFNRDHPERLDDEVYLGNFSDAPNEDLDGKSGWESIGWETKRRGKIAYDIYGKLLKGWDGYFPVFAKQSEIKAEDPKILRSLLPVK